METSSQNPSGGFTEDEATPVPIYFCRAALGPASRISSRRRARGGACTENGIGTSIVPCRGLVLSRSSRVLSESSVALVVLVVVTAAAAAAVGGNGVQPAGVLNGTESHDYTAFDDQYQT